jgi:hypothetical protein
MPVRDNSTIAKADGSYADARARRRAPTLERCRVAPLVRHEVGDGRATRVVSRVVSRTPRAAPAATRGRPPFDRFSHRSSLPRDAETQGRVALTRKGPLWPGL